MQGRSRTAALLTMSALFYGATSLDALAIVSCVVILSWLGGALVGRNRKTGIAVVVVVTILVPLIGSKYFPWLSGILAGESWWQSSALGERGIPPGLSFVTLQAIGYVVDVRRRLVTPTERLIDHALFLAFFPQLIAGPIERTHALRPQLAAPRRPTGADYYVAAKLILWGYTLKLLLADSLALPIDRLLATSGSLAPAALILGLFLFSARLYFDFYGYSCIAVGLGRAHGVALTMNFEHPYGAVGMAAFWRRWHVSLSTWWRDYVYRPLGGNRGSWPRQAAVVMAVFLLSGLWHGAGIGFLLWGAAHAILLLAERGARVVVNRYDPKALRDWGPLWRPTAALITGAAVTLCWLPFLATPERELPILAARLVDALGDVSVTTRGLAQLASDFRIPIALGALGLLVERPMRAWYWGHPAEMPPRIVTDVLLTNLMIVGLILFGDFGGGQTFIYFAF